MKILDYIIERAKEGSTWRGLILIASSLGATLNPELAEAIIGAGVGVFGLLQVLRKEKK